MEDLVEIQVFKKSMIEQLAKSINAFKDEQSIQNMSKLREFFDNNSRASGKTVERILNNKTTSPNAETVFHICCTLYGTTNYDEVIEIAPPAISRFIYNYVTKSSTFVDHRKSEDKYLFENQLALKIYYECTGHGSTIEKIKEKYGMSGFNEVKRMRERGILMVDELGTVQWGAVRLSNTISSLVEQNNFISKHIFRQSRSDKRGENFISVRTTSVSPLAYNKIIDLEEETQAMRVKIIREDDKFRNKSEQTIKMIYTTLIDKISED